MTAILRVARRFLADQPAGQRRKDRDLVEPVNRLKGIDRGLANEHGETQPVVSEATKPHRYDITPEDVFHPKPHQIGVLNLVETGKDMSKAISTQVPKDKGYSTVRNLSQYLVETKGGGGTKPVS